MKAERRSALRLAIWPLVCQARSDLPAKREGFPREASMSDLSRVLLTEASEEGRDVDANRVQVVPTFLNHQDGRAQ